MFFFLGQGGELYQNGTLFIMQEFWNRENTAVYLAILSETGLKVRAAKKAGCNLDTVEDRIKTDAQFRKDVQNADREYQELLVEELDRRGRKGVEKSVYFKGKVVGKELIYSDKCLELQLKARCPEFRERGIGIEVAQGGVLVVGVPQLDAQKWKDSQNGTTDKIDASSQNEGDNLLE